MSTSTLPSEFSSNSSNSSNSNSSMVPQRLLWAASVTLPFLFTQLVLQTKVVAPGELISNLVDDASMSMYIHKDSFNGTTLNAPVCGNISAEDVDFTLAIHLSRKRLGLMAGHCRRWAGHPISVAVGTPNTTRWTRKLLTSLGCSKKYVKLQTVMFVEGNESYPVNKLRNMALEGVNTSHAILLDADFLPSKDLYDNLILHRQRLTNPKKAIVIPAFDSNISSVLRIPDNKKGLLNAFGYPGRWRHGRNKLVREFAFDYRVNQGGHSSTDYKKWLYQKNETKLAPITCLKSPRYEPYLAFRYCQDLPPFQEQFSGYGQNKITWMLHFRRAGYKLYQLGPAFVVHVQHFMSPDKLKWVGIRKAGNKAPVEQTSKEFRYWLNNFVPDQTMVPDCQA